MNRALRRILLAVLWGAAVLGPAGCGTDPGSASLNEQIAKLERDNKALREAVAEARAGKLIRPNNVIIGVHERAVLAPLEVLLPIEQSIRGVAGAKDVRIRIEHASVRFDSGLGTVTVDGRAWLANWPSVAADVHLSGGFSEARIDPQKGLLIARLGLDTLEARPVRGGLLALLLRGRLLRALNARGRDEISRLLPPLDIPIKLDQKLEIPDREEDPLHVRGGSLSVAVTFTRMFASEDRLWVELEPKLGPWKMNAGPQ